MSNAREVVDRYFTAMASKDFTTMRTLLHDDVTFRGSFGTTNGAEDYIEGIKQTTANTTDLKRRVIFAEGEDVCQVYDMVSPLRQLPYQSRNGSRCAMAGSRRSRSSSIRARCSRHQHRDAADPPGSGDAQPGEKVRSGCTSTSQRARAQHPYCGRAISARIDSPAH